MCLDIVMDIDVTDITELIYTEVIKVIHETMTHYEMIYFVFLKRAVSISL